MHISLSSYTKKSIIVVLLLTVTPIPAQAWSWHTITKPFTACLQRVKNNTTAFIAGGFAVLSAFLGFKVYTTNQKIKALCQQSTSTHKPSMASLSSSSGKKQEEIVSQIPAPKVDAQKALQACDELEKSLLRGSLTQLRTQHANRYTSLSSSNVLAPTHAQEEDIASLKKINASLLKEIENYKKKIKIYNASSIPVLYKKNCLLKKQIEVLKKNISHHTLPSIAEENSKDLAEHAAQELLIKFVTKVENSPTIQQGIRALNSSSSTTKDATKD